MKRFISLSLTAMAIAVFTACGSPAAAPDAGSAGGTGGAGGATGGAATSPATTEQEADITNLRWIALSGGWEPDTLAARELFAEETGIHVEFVGLPFNDLFEVIEVRIASGTSDYDIISVDVPMVASYATRGLIQPLDRFFTADEKSQWIPSALQAGSWQGTFYAAPMNTSAQLLYYNIDLLAEAGITLRDNDSNNRLTYEELEDYARRAMDVLDPDRNRGLQGILFQQVSRTYQMNSLANSRGELNIGPDGFTLDGYINTDGWVHAFTWWQNLFNDGLSLRGLPPENSTPNFNSGNVIFMIGGTWTPAQAPDVNFGFAPMPAWRGFEDQVGTPTGSWHFGINAHSNHTEAAAEFIRFMSLGLGNQMFLDLHGPVPATMSGIRAIEENPDANPVMRMAIYEAANTAVPRALTPGWPEYSSIMDATFEDIRNGADVRGALDEAAMRLTSMMERHR